MGAVLPHRLKKNGSYRGAAVAAACGATILALGKLDDSFVTPVARPSLLDGGDETVTSWAPQSRQAPAASAGTSTAALVGVGGLMATALSLATARRRAVGTGSKSTARVTPAVARQATIMSERPSEAVEEDYEESALVQKTSVLVLGSTGTLGRQVVRQFLMAGYSVRCMLRNRADRPFSFLMDWGAQVVEGSLTRPETLPSSLIGIHTVIDCSAAQPEEDIYSIDWEGKKRFIQCCEKMKVQRYIFMSIKDCDKYQNVPLMQIKYLTEKFLAKSGLRYTVLRASGFMQPLISQYAVNILDDEKVFGDDGSSPGIAYLDSQDCARFIAAAATKERTIGKTLLVSGPRVWSTNDVIELCEDKSGRKADVNVVSNFLLQATQLLAGGFMWSVDIAERLRFVEVNTSGSATGNDVMTKQEYDLLGIDPENTRKLEDYMGEFYRRVFKKLTKGKYEPEEGEVEKEKEEEERKLQSAIRAQQEDLLPPGQPEEQDVTLLSQRDTADRIQEFFEDEEVDKRDSSSNSWVGLTPVAEVINGRAAMSGFSLGLFTEWATDVSVSKQIDDLIAIFSPQG